MIIHYTLNLLREIYYGLTLSVNIFGNTRRQTNNVRRVNITGMVKKIWDFLGSLRLAIILIIIFSIVSFVGIVIPQGLPKEQYIKRWGEFLGNGMVVIGITRIFSSPGFYILLQFLSLNVLVCASMRIWKSIKQVSRFNFWSSTEKLATFKHFHSFDISQNAAAAEKSVLSYFKRHYYSLSTQPTDSGTQICALKGKLKASGLFLFHIGIIVLFLGGLYGRMRGHSYYQQLKKGETVAVKNRDFLLRCDRFQLQKNEEGAIKDYKSKLVLLNMDSSVIKEKEIEVNDPLSYKGIRFYQTSYGQDQTNIEDVLLNIKGPGLAQYGAVSSFEFDKETYVPHSDIKIHIQEYVPDFSINIKTKKVTSRSDKPNNPALKVVLLKGTTDTLLNKWIFKNFPNQHASKSDYTISFMSYTPNYYTGIQIRNNPGVPIIWVGILIMTFGVFATFYSSREKLWVFIESAEEEKQKISIGGLLLEGFSFSQSRFEDICQSIEQTIKSS